jgi:hypothetical protein
MSIMFPGNIKKNYHKSPMGKDVVNNRDRVYHHNGWHTKFPQ